MTVLTIILFGFLGFMLGIWCPWGPHRTGWRRPLPPASRKQLDRAARANRAVFTGTPPARPNFDDDPTEDFEPPRAA